MANNISVKDASAVTQTVKTTDNAGIHTPHQNIDSFPGTAEADITAIKTAVQQLDDTVSGSELQVDIISLPANIAVADGGAAGLGLLVQGYDGAVRQNILTDSDGHLQVDILSGGSGGTEYTEGDTDTTITGVAVLWEDASDTLRAVSAAKPLPTDVISLPGTVASDITAIKNAVELLDNAIAGNELQVDIVSSANLTVVGTGTFTVQIDGAALTALQLIDDVVKTEDTAHVSGDKGIPLLTVRQADNTALASTNGDYQPLVTDDEGALYVYDTALESVILGGEIQADIVAPLPTGSNTIGVVDLGATDNAVLDTIASQTTLSAFSLSVIDDLVIDVGSTTYTEAASKGVLIAGVRNDTLATLANLDNELAPFQVDASGAIYVNIEDAAGNIFSADATAYGKGVLIQGDDGTDRRSLLVDTDGHLQVDILSGGTSGQQYTEGDIDASITGTAIMWEDASNTLKAVSASNALPINITNASLAVSQSGTWNINNISGTISLPTGAATESSLSSAITALQLIDDIVYAEDTPHANSDKGAMILSVRKDTAVALSGADSDYQPLITDANGRLHVVMGPLSAGSNNIGDVDIASALPAGDNNIGNVDIVTLPGTVQADIGDIKTAVQLLDNAISGNELQVDLVGSLPAGTNNIGDVDIASAIPAGSNLIGDVGIGVRTSGGTSFYKNIDVDQTEDEIKASAGQIYWCHVMNMSNAVRYLKFYNATAASVTVGTTTPDLTFPIPTQGDTNGAGFVLPIPNGIEFSTAITIAATTGLADADTGAPGNNEVVVNIGYE